MRKGITTLALQRQSIFLIGFFLSLSLYAVWLDRVERNLYGVEPGVVVDGIDLTGKLPEEVEIILQELAIKHKVLPVNPMLDKETGEIIAEKNGYEVNIDATMESIFAAPPGQNVYLVKNVIRSRYTSEDLKSLTRQMGYFHTWFYGSGGRWQNINLACKSCNNTIVWPGKVFSFNEVVGPRTPERGYAIAPVISGHDFGGGVCQASTTVYNAALKSGLPIIERHTHSQPVPYIARGRDAAVSYNAADMKFLNDRDHPIIVKAGLDKGKIYAYILGK